MTRTLLAAAASIVFLAAASSDAPMRVRGTVTSVSSNTIGVKGTNGNDYQIEVGDKTRLVFAQPIALSDIKPGDFLGVTSLKRKEGTLMAYDVRRFPKPVNPGHRPFDGLADQTMTNAAVSGTAKGVSGPELQLTYEGGSQKVVIAKTAQISNLVPGERSQLVKDSYVSLLADKGADGKLTARSIEMRKEAPKAPQ
ncbi:MAG TPA: DUF5666 domain-containing protein [Burkholderiales bacterium]|nr:DUF5666 domain-containing protein [Burkholderiales bacterium]